MSASFGTALNDLVQPLHDITLGADDAQPADTADDDTDAEPVRSYIIVGHHGEKVDLRNLSLAQFIEYAGCLSDEMRDNFIDQREPVAELPPRFFPVQGRPKQDLILYGIPANIDDIYAIAENDLRAKGIPFEDDPRLFYAALKIINEACGVGHITAHRPMCPFDADRNWLVALYTNRNMARLGFPDAEKEDRFVEIIQGFLGTLAQVAVDGAYFVDAGGDVTQHEIWLCFLSSDQCCDSKLEVHYRAMKSLGSISLPAASFNRQVDVVATMFWNVGRL